MTRFFNIAIVLMLFAGIAACTSPKNAETNSQNTVNQPSIKEQVAKGAFLVDVRTPEEFAEGSVKGAVNIPLNEVKERVKEFEGKPAVIVFCRSGKRSGEAKEILEENGIKNVTNGINTENMEREMK